MKVKVVEIKYKKCRSCYYNKRNQNIYPCSICEDSKSTPLTCYHCKKYQCGKHGRGDNKSIRICNEFEWD